MIDISPIEKYIRPVDKFHIDFIKSDIDKLGKDVVFENHLHYLDCSCISKNGERLQQTIGFPYISEMSQIVYIIQTYFIDDADEKLKQVLDLHNRNLEFEKENPPIWYGGDKARKKFENSYKLPRRRNVDKSIKKEISNAERLNKLNATFGKLKFNIKISRNE